VVATETCNSSAFAENGGTDRHHVPNFLPGQNQFWKEWLKDEPWIPEAAVRGGVKTIYPEYRSKMPQPEKPKLACERYCDCGAGANGGCLLAPTRRGR
jgi:hypothetical protein